MNICMNICFLFCLQKPDIGVELTGGCQGFATKFMDWPEELLVGGVIKNQSQVIRRCAMHVVVAVFFSIHNRVKDKAGKKLLQNIPPS